DHRGDRRRHATRLAAAGCRHPTDHPGPARGRDVDGQGGPRADRRPPGCQRPRPGPDTLAEVSHRLEQARGLHALGGTDLASYANDPLRSELLWHFGVWRLQELRRLGLGPEDMLPQAVYPDVVVVMADLCAFSSYVRDTSDDEVIRDNLTAFYAKARSQ